ncbi:hypothetical protein DSO57_1034550 [Entomophthora muscae]|uniref:Uncharacterized protein n=1 Tax=Entomophthora muscae TaxID=34485 RepID=A0ACC2TAM6_9FUNG|nr:hypothetical protein DSO57_1034550 [Entomophthora muscae]
MKGILFLFWFLVLLLTVVLGFENPTPAINWHNSSPNDSHQKESLANGWFKYPSCHWGRKFHNGCTTNPPPPVEPLLVRPNASFYLLTYVVAYYLLGHYSSMMGSIAFLGHFGHLAMVTVPIGLDIAGLNIGALAHQIGNIFPFKQGPWHYSKSILFKDKYNLLSAYQLNMKLPITPKLMSMSPPKLPMDHSNKLFEIVYITLSGVIDTIILDASLWSWVGKSFVYFFKLAPILWWALPAKTWPIIFLIILGKEHFQVAEGHQESLQAHQSHKEKGCTSKKAFLKPFPKPSFEQSPAYFTGIEKYDDSITDHSSYHLTSDKESSKKRRQAQKNPPQG